MNPIYIPNLKKIHTFTRYCRYPIFRKHFFIPLYIFSLNLSSIFIPTNIKVLYPLYIPQYIMSFFAQYIYPNMNANGIIFLLE